MPYDSAQQFSAKHVLVSPNGYRASFNDPADADYVGVLSDEEAITGLDAAPTRPALYDKVQTDGAVAGLFFTGARPITLKPVVVAATPAARTARIGKLRKAWNDCASSSGILAWTPTGSIEQFVSVRKHEALRETGGFAKKLLVPLIAPEPLIFSSTLQTVTVNPATNGTATNEGWTPSPPELIRVTGPGTSPTIKNTTTGRNLKLDGLTLTAGQYVDLDVMNATAVRSDGTSVYAYVDFPSNADWWTLMPGANTVRVDWASGSTAASTIRVDWRHAWL